MLLKWGRFVTNVKLNRGLKTSNYDQLYAYLKHHEEHANKNKMILERYNQQAIDPLAFVSNLSPQQYLIQSSTIPQSAYIPPVIHQPQFADHTPLDSGITPTDDLIENLTKTDRQNRGQGNYVRGAVTARNRGAYNKVGNTNPGQAKQIKCYNCNGVRHIARKCTHPKRQQNLEYIKDKILLMQAQENGVVLDEEQLLFIAVDQCDAFDSDVDEVPNTHTMFMGNLSSADPIYVEAGPS
ncbi:retrovirus-related pol polyprotein from transposon TNT 1-94 [Tanacetum coccineum]